MQDNLLRDWLILHFALGQSAGLCHRLIEYFVNPTRVFQQSDLTLRQWGLNTQQLQRLRQVDSADIEAVWRWLDATDHHIVTLADATYPVLLKHIASPPLLLYIEGDPGCLHSSQVSMVGSRNPSHYGREIAFEFAHALSQQGMTITSGLALGIDGHSHRGALAAGGPTIAVLGSGLNQVYPRAHLALAEQIRQQGALVSEFPLASTPQRQNFPRRNRIISGLSLGLIVVEASLRSGSLISARFALEQNREVFAVPGSIHNPLSKGCLHLIQQGAKAIEKIEDILAELMIGQNIGSLLLESARQKEYREPTEPKLIKLLECIETEDTIVEKIIARSGLNAQTVSSMLLNLELHGYIMSSPNGYRRIT